MPQTDNQFTANSGNVEKFKLMCSEADLRKDQYVIRPRYLPP